MKQHSGQHLISAIFEISEFQADTTSWNMGEEISHIELSRPVTAVVKLTLKDFLAQKIFKPRNFSLSKNF